MPSRHHSGSTRVAAIAAIAIILTVGYAFLVGFGSLGGLDRGISGNNGLQPGLISATTSTVTETATSIIQQLETTTLTYTYTSSNAFTSTTVVQTTTITYTTTSTRQSSTSTPCTIGQCITLVATSSTDINQNGQVSFRAVDPIPQEKNDPFTGFMNCGCNGGVVHGYFVDGVGTFSVKFTLTGDQKVWVADGDLPTNATTQVYSNSIPVQVN